MRNKKNIRRKKKLNTPKPSVLAQFSETRRGGEACQIYAPLSLSLSLQLASLLLVSVHGQVKMLPFLHQMSPFANNSCQTGWLHGRVRCYTERRWNTPLAGWHRAQRQLKLHSERGEEEREGGREREGWVDGGRDRCGGGSL